ncbi:MAG TPA: redoxin domain-containing protein [Kofleriaceae bacterium]
MRCWIVLAFACAACASTPGAPATPVAKLDPTGLVREMASRYHRLGSYADRGKVTVTVTSAGQTQSEAHAFATAYVRDGRMHFAFDPTAGSAESFELWSDGKHTYVKAPALDHITDFESQAAAALGGLAEASHGVTRRALWNLDHPPLLHGALAFADATDRAWHLVNQDEELFIDRRSLLLTKVIEHHHFAPTAARPVAADLTVTIDYEPTPNPQLADAALAPPALTLPIESMFPPAWLGIMPDGATSKVASVVAGGPAEKAGLQPGDEITAIDGHPITTSKEVVAASHAMKPQHAAKLEVKRGGATVPITVVAEPRPNADQLQAGLVGRPAPALSVAPLAGGAALELAPGRVTVLDFWATWCGPCTILSPHLDDLSRAHPELRVVGISDEDKDTVAAFLVTHKMTYPVALDADNKATRAYLVQGLPSVFVIDKAGVIRYAAVGVPDFKELDAAIASAAR